MVIVNTIGIYFMISGIFVVIQRKTFASMLKDLFSHRIITYIVGIVLVIGGTAMVLANKNAGGISTFVEVISWMILIKGIFYVFFPKIMYDMLKGVSRLTYSLMGIAIIAIGAYLVFFL